MTILAVERSRWLAELAKTLEEAQRLVWEIGSRTGLSTDTLDLCARLEVVRAELESIRRARGKSLGPNRNQLCFWGPLRETARSPSPAPEMRR